MSRGRVFLLEVGCEEIPAAILPGALSDLTTRLLEALGGETGLGGQSEMPPPFGGPRRLVACIAGIRDREEDRVALVTGPPVTAAWDKEGNPTKAALGFARAQGVGVDQLERVKGEKSEVVAARKQVIGRNAREVLAEACPRILSSMRFPKMMKWGERGYCFVRPVTWILALLDDQAVEFEFMGVRSSRRTLGHRFLAPGPHEVADAGQYEDLLGEKGHVIVRNSARADRIRESRDRAASAMGWRAREDDDLLTELCFLNEYPGIVTGTFSRDFLDLPEPVIVTAMRHHQKYFPVSQADGTLAPGFLAVINLPEDPDGVIRRGNEWVLKARLADARFFWIEDRKRKLEDRVADLARVTFQEKLGSNEARTKRLETLSADLGGQLSLAPATIEQTRLAARLAKCDLTTGMVGEFPELQGRMGGIYARQEGLSEEVARAIEEHYLPLSPDGPIPETVPGAVLALADKIDLLAGGFAAGLVPRGSTDPYGLRRAAQGVTRILLSSVLDGAPGRISLAKAIQASLTAYVAQKIPATPAPGAAQTAADFIAQRLRHLMEESGMRFDTARAVLAAGFDDVADAWRRAAALTLLRGAAGEADFLALAAAAKRIRNILAQAREKGVFTDGREVDASRLVDAEEIDLQQAVARVGAGLARPIDAGDYTTALKSIASLRPFVDRFFDKVLVMAPDEGLKANRLALLSGLSHLLSKVADFSEIVVEGETAVKKG